MESKINILIVDDEEIIRNEISEFLTDNMYNHYLAGKPSEALKIIETHPIDIIFTDINMPEMTGLEMLKNLKADYPEIEIIMMTGQGNVDKVIQAMRYGAMDFFYKPLRLFEIQAAIERTKKYIQLKRELIETADNYNLLSNELQETAGSIIGNSQKMREVIDLTMRAAQSNDTSVMITGPSGSGKELIARAIHYSSQRKKHYFYPLNCSSIPETLFESELFGHKRGAFTGAAEDKKGCFESADKGILFLDEIGDMPYNMQSKILRTLEDKKIKRLGSNTETEIDVRIISATHRDIENMIESNKFRLDLYYRLNTLEIKLPALKDRVEDIPLIIEHYIKYFNKKMKKQIQSIEKNALDLLMNYDFPGNIRELKNIIERAFILSSGNKLKIQNIILTTASVKNVKTNSIENNSIKTDIFNLEKLEKNAILAALKKTNNNKTEAAELLNISWFALNRKLKKIIIH